MSGRFSSGVRAFWIAGAYCILAVWLCSSSRESVGQSPDSSAADPLEAPAPQTSESPTDAAAPKKSAAWDPQLVSSGQSAFESRCTDCHDANKSLGGSKSLGAWKATVRRMAAQDGAEIPQSEWDAIATYLASRSPENKPGEAGGAASDSGPASNVQVFGTISPTFRTHSSAIQNPGFFPDTWLGVNWQPEGPLSVKAVGCITCHNEAGEGYLSRFELVQATLRLDIGQWLKNEGVCPATSRMDASVEAGRFVVPFGAFASQVNPGVYRTVSRPLMFNMGQRIFDENLGDPVLPMPYSDEGANFNISVPLFEDVTFGMDTYVVNGLQGDGVSINFDDSRDYSDNNRTPAVGGRWTVGNSMLRLGSSAMTGRYNGLGSVGPNAAGTSYSIFGADATFRYEDILRVQAEFAQRNTETFIDQPGQAFGTDRVRGGYVESELWLFDNLSLLCRWDLQRQHYANFDPASGLPSAQFDVQRWTYGINWAVTGNSLLMLNLEHWKTPHGVPDVNVVGIRWSASF